MVLSVLPVLLLLPLLALAHPAPHPDGAESVKRALPSRWYHEPGHPVEKLFKRQNGDVPTDGVTYPPVGSPEWAAGFPDVHPSLTNLPTAWVDALNAAVAAGKIPNIPEARDTGGNPVYPSGVNPLSPEVCSGTAKCRNPDDIWDAPDGVLALSFDDGPYLGSTRLYDFLAETNLPTTHFMIGYYIKLNPDLFIRAFDELNQDIAVHTWSHRHMTTLSNIDIVSEFGWTMEIIKNSTGGRLPRYWRPPYGDADNRVRAIAKEVFGLQAIFWNQDTSDWTLGESGGATPQSINASMTRWINGPKSPGLMILEHELSVQSSQVFIDAYPAMVNAGWRLESAAQLNGNSAYLNSRDSNSPVERAEGVLAGQTYSSSSTPSSTVSPPSDATGSTNNPGSNTSQSGNNGSIQSTISKLAGALGAIFLTVVFYAW